MRSFREPLQPKNARPKRLRTACLHDRTDSSASFKIGLSPLEWRHRFWNGPPPCRIGLSFIGHRQARVRGEKRAFAQTGTLQMRVATRPEPSGDFPVLEKPGDHCIAVGRYKCDPAKSP